MAIHVFGKPQVESVIERFSTVALGAGQEVRHHLIMSRLLTALRGGELVLYCFGPEQKGALLHVRDITERGSRVVVLATPEAYNREDATLLMTQGAYEVLSYLIFPRDLHQIRQLIWLQKRPYSEIRGLDKKRFVAGAKVFIITPFAQPAKAIFEGACQSALLHLGLTPDLGDSDIGTSSDGLLSKLTEHTSEACMVIANPDEPFNTNVAIEIGLAHGLKVPCLLTWKRGTHQLPANLAGLDRLEYDDEVELAKRITAGLLPHVTWKVQ